MSETTIFDAAEQRSWEWRAATYHKTVQSNPFIPEYVRGKGLGGNAKQRLFLLLSDVQEVFYGGSAGGGKMLRLDEPVPTPTGWTTIGELAIGDRILDENGRECRVTWLSPINPTPEVYRLEFDDGTVIEACADHQWKTLSATDLLQLTRSDPDRRARRRASRPSRATGSRSSLFTATISARNSRTACSRVPTVAVRTTREIAETVRTARGRVNHAVPVAAPLELPDAILPLDPYLLGVWLGDGTTAAGSVTSADPEILERFDAAGFERGYTGVREGNKSVTQTFRGLRVVLKTAGVFENKHVPKTYLRGSRAQRLELLRGLMDTDGTVCESGSVEFTNTNKRLVDGVFELIVSLGWKARVVESRAKLNGQDIGPKWDIKWTPSEHVFRLERKRSKQKLATRRTTKFRYIVDCRPCGSSPMRCITVDSPSHLFLVSRAMVPTHNTVATLVAAAQFVDVPGYSALLLRENYGDLNKPGAWMDLSRQWWYGKGVKWNERDRVWTFPSGATITFGYLDSDKAVYQYDSASFHFVAIDELTQHTEWRYRFMFGRIRRPKSGALSQVPLRMRATSNPGNKGHCIEYGMILTPSGWRDVREFAVGDPVYAVAPDGRLVSSVVEQVHRVPYTGEMVRVKTGSLRMNCTPDHRVAKVGGSKRVRNTKFTLTPFDALPGQATILRTVAWWGTPVTEFSPPPVPTRRRRLSQPRSVTGDQFAELMGWFLSEGHTVDRDKAFGISQKKSHNREKIAALLDRCGFKYGASTAGFLVHAADWWAYLRQFGKCRDKYIPADLKGASAGQLRILFDALMAGDGHWSSQTAGEYYTSSQRLADDVAEVAVKLGYIVHVKSRQRRNRHGLSYAVAFNRTKSGGTELLTGNHVYKVGTRTKRRSDICREPFEGEVYCIGVPDHHAFVVMQDGAVWVSGNSWVKRRFVDARTREPGAVFVQAKLEDNAGNLDVEEYKANQLAKLDPLTRAQRERGDWDAVAGGRFRDEWLRHVWVRDKTDRDLITLYHTHPLTGARTEVERFDASAAPTFQTYDPSASASTAADEFAVSTWKLTPRAHVVWWDCFKDRKNVPDQVRVVRSLYREHRPQFIAVEKVMNQTAPADYLRESTNPVCVVRAVSPGGKDKLTRAQGGIILAESGRLFLPESHPTFPLDEVRGELVRFTGLSPDETDNCVDTLSYATECLHWVRPGGPRSSSSVPFAHVGPAARSPYAGLR